MRDERVSPVQAVLLLLLSRMALSLVYFPSAANTALKQDVWLGTLAGALWLIPCSWFMTLLWRQFPGQGFLEASEIALGKVLGRTVVSIYSLDMLFAASANLRMVGEFFTTSFLPRTPLAVVITVVAFLSAWAAKAGVEVIGRTGLVIIVLVITSVLLVLVLLLKDIKLSSLEPLYIPHPFIAVTQETFNVMARTTEFVWLGILVPGIEQPGRLFRTLAFGFLVDGAFFTVLSVTVTGTMGSTAANLNFPFFSATRLIEVADFLERFDALILGVWLFGMFVRIALFLWAAGRCAAHALSLKQYRPLVVPLAAIAVTYACTQAENLPELREYLGPTVLTPYRLVATWIVPILVWLIALLRKAIAPAVQSPPAPPAR